MILYIYIYMYIYTHQIIYIYIYIHVYIVRAIHVSIEVRGLYQGRHCGLLKSPAQEVPPSTLEMCRLQVANLPYLQ